MKEKQQYMTNAAAMPQARINPIILAIAIVMALLAMMAASIGAQAQELIPAAVNNFAVGVDSTTTAVFGHRPVQTEIVVENISAETRVFSATVYYFGPAWGGENHPYTMTVGSESTWLECGTDIARDGCKYWWHGTLAPDEQASFYLKTFTGIQVGTFPFIQIEIEDPYNLFVQRDLTITRGEGAAYGEITLDGGDSWRPGSYQNVRMEVFSAELTQFVSNGATTATCAIEGSLYFTGDYNRTYGQFQSYMRLSEDAQPGACTMSIPVRSIWTNEEFVVQKTFEVEKLPTLVLNNDIYTMTAGTTGEFAFLANDDIDWPDQGWSVGLEPVEMPFEYEHFSPGFLRVKQPSVGVYTFTYAVQIEGLYRDATITVNVEPKVLTADVWTNVSMQTGKIGLGESFTMTVQFGNNGPDTVVVGEVVDLPSGKWMNEEVLDPGQIRIYSFNPTLEEDRIYAASIGITEGTDSNQTNNRVSISTVDVPSFPLPCVVAPDSCADMQVTLTVEPTEVEAGDMITVTAVVTNAGPAKVTASLSVEVPSYVSANDLKELAAGESYTWQKTYKAILGGEVKATVAADATELRPGDEETTVKLTVTPKILEPVFIYLPLTQR